MAQGALWYVVVIDPSVFMEGLFEGFRGVEVVGLEYFCDSSIEAFHHTIGLRAAGLYEAMIDVFGFTELIKGVFTCRSSLPCSTEAVGEFFAVVGEDGFDLEGGCIQEFLEESYG